MGIDNYFVPVGVFGIHEILREKYAKGLIYITSVNVLLVMQSKIPVWGEVACLVFVLIAIIDTAINF